MTNVPAAEQALAILELVAKQPGPIPAGRICAELDLPRSTTYHLLRVLCDRGFVVHLPEERRYGLGVSAFELGSAYSRQAPLARLARPVLARLVDGLGENAHLAVLHGREVVYVVEERAKGRESLVTEVGVRLPASLTASGRAILAGLPPPQVTALFPNADALVQRESRGPSTPTELRRLLSATRQRGYASEDGEVSSGFCSVALPVRDHNDLPVAGVAVTWRSDRDVPVERVLARLRPAAEQLSARVSGRRP